MKKGIYIRLISLEEFKKGEEVSHRGRIGTKGGG